MNLGFRDRYAVILPRLSAHVGRPVNISSPRSALTGRMTVKGNKNRLLALRELLVTWNASQKTI